MLRMSNLGFSKAKWTAPCRKTLAAMSMKPVLHASADFVDHWCWESDLLILAQFDAEVNAL